MNQELEFLRGLVLGMRLLRRSWMHCASADGAGKLGRIGVIVDALQKECKAFSYRYQLETEKNQDWKRYLTVWQHYWVTTNQLDMSQALEQIATDLGEVSRHFENAVNLSWSDDVLLEE